MEPLERRELLALTLLPIKTTGGIRINDVATDASGNIYATGEFQGTTTFNTAGTVKLTALGDADAFVMRIAAKDGATVVRRLNSSSAPSGTSRLVTPNKLLVQDGHVTVIGTFTGKVDLDPTKGTKSVEAKGKTDCFALDLAAATLNYNWASAFGGTGSERPNSLDRDSKGNTWINGTFQGTMTFAGSPAPQLTSGGSFDAFAVKLGPTGAHLFSTRIGGAGDDVFTGVAVDSKDNVLLSGQFQKSIDTNPSSAKAIFTTTGTTTSCMLVKLSSAGAFVTSRGFIGTGFASPIDIAVDSKDAVYMLTNFDQAIDVNPTSKVTTFTSKGFGDIWVSKLDANLAPVWNYTFGAAGSDQSQDIYIDSKDQIFISGSVQNAVDLNPTSAKAVLTSTGTADAFVSSFTAAGKFQGAAKIGGPGNSTVMGTARSGSTLIAATLFQGVVDIIAKPVPAGTTSPGSELFDSGDKIQAVMVPIPLTRVGAV